MRESPKGRSQLNLAKVCQRKWAFKYLKGFKLIGEVSIPLTIGSIIHELQEIFYQSKSSEKCLTHLKTIAISAEICYKIETMFKAWVKALGNEDLKSHTVLALEKEAIVTLPNGYEMTVRWDRVMLHHETGEIFINDTKTTSGSAIKTVREYMHSDQPKLYIASVLQTKPDWYKQFRGWRTDAIFGGKFLKSGIHNTDVIRSEIVTFTDEEIEDTLIGYASLVDDIAFKLKNVKNGESIRSNFIPSSSMCFNYGRLCEYYSICHQIDRLDVPPANMEVDPWIEDRIVLNTFENF